MWDQRDLKVNRLNMGIAGLTVWLALLTKSPVTLQAKWFLVMENPTNKDHGQLDTGILQWFLGFCIGDTLLGYVGNHGS